MKLRLVRANLGKIVLSLIFYFFAMFSAQSENGPSELGTNEQATDRMALARTEAPPLGLPVVPVPENNPITIEKIALGRKLFFDHRLSFNGTMSCGMCHIPEQGFTNNQLSIPIGVEGQSLKRNAPTILNVAYAPLVLLDGREVSLERQTILPLLAHNEMANPSTDWLVAKLDGLLEYRGLFEGGFRRRPQHGPYRESHRELGTYSFGRGFTF